jgi:hypothetical protein
LISITKIFRKKEEENPTKKPPKNQQKTPQKTNKKPNKKPPKKPKTNKNTAFKMTTVVFHVQELGL